MLLHKNLTFSHNEQIKVLEPDSSGKWIRGIEGFNTFASIQLGKSDGIKVSNMKTSAWQRRSILRSNANLIDRIQLG